MCLKSHCLLIGVLLALSVYSPSSTWQSGSTEHGKYELLAGDSPASAGVAGVSGLRHDDYSSGGLRDVNYLVVFGGPEPAADVAGPVPVDMQALEPVPEPVPERAHPTTRGEATWYHPSLAWADDMRIGGKKYNPRDAGIAAVADIRGQPVVELGTVLEVCHGEADTCIVVTVQDTGYLGEKNIDLSEDAFKRLAPLHRGRIPISWRVIDYGG